MTLAGAFGHGSGLAGWQECLRALVVFVYGLAAVRIAGRRVFGRWTALDIVVAIVFGSSLSRAITGNADLAGTLAAMTLLLALHWLLARAASRWNWASRLLEGVPVVLGQDGKVAPEALRRDGISRNDLGEALRQNGLEEVSGSRLVVLEPSGKITVLKP